MWTTPFKIKMSPVVMGIITSSFMTKSDPVTGFTSRDRDLVQSSWKPFKNDLNQTGSALLLEFYKRYPDEQGHFPFKDIPREELGQHEKFQAFCKLVSEALDALIDSLNDGETLVNLLEDLGRGHRKYGVKLESFARLKETLIDLFRNSMSNEELDAWDKVLNVAFTILEKEL